jgi:hypothetical protein
VDITPVQARAYDELLSPGERPVFPDDIADRLRADLEDQLADVAPAPDADPFVVAKGALSRVHGCEANHIAEQAAGFTWSAGTARGAIAHKAIELGFGMRDQVAPLELVDLAIDRVLEDERGPAFMSHPPVTMPMWKSPPPSPSAHWPACWPLRPAGTGCRRPRSSRRPGSRAPTARSAASVEEVSWSPSGCATGRSMPCSTT